MKVFNEFLAKKRRQLRHLETQLQPSQADMLTTFKGLTNASTWIGLKNHKEHKVNESAGQGHSCIRRTIPSKQQPPHHDTLHGCMSEQGHNPKSLLASHSVEGPSPQLEH